MNNFSSHIKKNFRKLVRKQVHNRANLKKIENFAHISNGKQERNKIGESQNEEK